MKFHISKFLCLIFISNIFFLNSNGQTADWEKKLTALNAYISQKFDNTFEVKGNKIINHFSNSSAEAKISDLYNVVKMPRYNYVYFTCKDEMKCVYSHYTKYNHPEFTFQCANESEMEKTFELIADFWQSMSGVNSKTKYSNAELLKIQNIESQKLKLIDVPKSEENYSTLKKSLNKNIIAVNLWLNYDSETYSGKIGIDNNVYSVKRIKVNINPLIGNEEVLDEDFDALAETATKLNKNMEDVAITENVITIEEKKITNQIPFDFMKAFNYLIEKADVTKETLHLVESEEMKEMKKIKNEKGEYVEYSFTQDLQPDFVFLLSTAQSMSYQINKEHPEYFITKVEFEKASYQNKADISSSTVLLYSKFQNDKVKITIQVNKKHEVHYVDLKYAYVPAIPIEELMKNLDKDILAMLAACARFDFYNIVSTGKGLFLNGNGYNKSDIPKLLAEDTVVTSIKNYGLGFKQKMKLNDNSIDKLVVDPYGNHKIYFESKKMDKQEALSKAKYYTERVKEITGNNPNTVSSELCEINCKDNIEYKFTSSLHINKKIATMNSGYENEQIGLWFRFAIRVFPSEESFIFTIAIE